jgi:hypothetical protein
LVHFLTTYGYWAVLIFVAIESTGIPFLWAFHRCIAGVGGLPGRDEPHALAFLPAFPRCSS